MTGSKNEGVSRSIAKQPVCPKALGSCDLAGTHVVWLKKPWDHAIWLELMYYGSKSFGVMRFGWNSYISWLQKLAEKKEENEALRANFFIRDRERSNNYVRKHSEFSCVCFLRCAASEFRTFGFQRLVSDFRGLFRISEGCFGFQRVVSEFWR